MEVVAAMEAAAVAAHTSAPRGKVLLRCALRLLRPTVGPSRGTTAWLAPGRSGAGRCSRGGTVLLTDLLTLDSLHKSAQECRDVKPHKLPQLLLLLLSQQGGLRGAGGARTAGRGGRCCCCCLPHLLLEAPQLLLLLSFFLRLLLAHRFAADRLCL